MTNAEKMLKWLGIALCVFVIVEPYPLYRMGSLFVEGGFLIAGALMIPLLAMLSLKIGYLKERILGRGIVEIVIFLSLLILFVLSFLGVWMILVAMMGATAMEQQAYVLNTLIWTGLDFIAFTAAAVLTKKYELVLVGALLPCLVAAGWALLKLHG